MILKGESEGGQLEGGHLGYLLPKLVNKREVDWWRIGGVGPGLRETKFEKQLTPSDAEGSKLNE